MKDSMKTTVLIFSLVFIFISIIALGVLFIFINSGNQNFNQELRNDVRGLYDSVESLEEKVDNLESENDDRMMDSKNSSTSQSSAVQKSTTTKVKTYTSSEYGYSVAYPQGWFVDAENAYANFYSENVDSERDLSDGEAYFGVVAWLNPEELSIPEFVDGLESFVETENASTLTRVELSNGLTAYQRTESGDGFYKTSTFVSSGEYVYELSGGSDDAKSFDTYSEEYQAFLNSFEG